MFSNPIQNFMAVLECTTQYSCGPLGETDSGFMIAVTVFLAPLTVAPIWLFTSLFHKEWRKIIAALLGTCWFGLMFGYAVPYFWGANNYVAWSIQVPLFTAFLMTGILAMGLLATLIVISVKQPNKLLPNHRGEQALMLSGVVLVLIVWRYAYLEYPEIAIGPFGRGPEWFQAALTAWSLRWPIQGLWAFAEFFTGPIAIAVFTILAALSFIASGNTRAEASRYTPTLQRSLGTVVTTASSLVILPTITVVAGFILFAAGALILLAAMIYFMYIALLVLISGLFVNAIIRR